VSNGRMKSGSLKIMFDRLVMFHNSLVENWNAMDNGLVVYWNAMDNGLVMDWCFMMNGNFSNNMGCFVMYRYDFLVNWN